MSGDDQRWTTADVAAYLGVKQSTVRSYAARGQMPKADGHHDARTPWWKPETIKAWR